MPTQKRAISKKRSPSNKQKAVAPTDASTANIRPPIASIAEAAEVIHCINEHVGNVSVALEEGRSLMNGLPTADVTESNSSALARLVQESISDTETGEVAVLKTISEIYRIKEASQEAVCVISNTSFRLQQIMDNYKAVQEMGQQLNMLAVNSRILAAQAGKHGSAFQVIAEQIEGIGNRLTEDFNEVEALIQTTLQESRSANTLIERSAHSIDPGVEVANEAERAFGKIRQNCTEAQNIARNAMNAAQSSKQLTDCLGRATNSVQTIATETNMLADWCRHSRQNAEQAMGKAVEEWNSFGQHALEFAKQMEQAARVQEKTLRRLDDLVVRLDRKKGDS